MRRKKHLDERLMNVSNYLIVAERDISNVNKAILDKKIVEFESAFQNNNPIELEVGCGKGGFISQLAIKNKDKNYIAVEMMQNIILLACENAKKFGITNVKFMNTGAEYLPRYLKKNSIENIYLNFSPPYPNKPYENRRLTNDRFISVYSYLLKDNGKIYQKTDDKVFFDYSFNKFIENGYEVEDISEKIEKNLIDNIKTEYEEKFLKQNMKIYGLIAKKVVK